MWDSVFEPLSAQPRRRWLGWAKDLMTAVGWDSSLDWAMGSKLDSTLLLLVRVLAWESAELSVAVSVDLLVWGSVEQLAPASVELLAAASVEQLAAASVEQLAAACVDLSAWA